jgi:beta-lactam-binding protein with PASTA domain
VWRDGIWQRDNGYCRSTVSVVYFSGYGPQKTAGCKPNEVEVPRVVGQTVDAATSRLALQPLEAAVIYKPAAPGQPLGVVVGQIPSEGKRLSSHDVVKLVLAKPLHGVVPRVVGLPLEQARQRLARLGLRPVVARRTLAARTAGRVVAQRPRAGVAAAAGMSVTLLLARGRADG